MLLSFLLPVVGAKPLSAPQVAARGGAFVFRAAWKTGAVVRYQTVFEIVRDGKRSLVEGPTQISVEGVVRGTADARVTVGPFRSGRTQVSSAVKFRSKIGPQLGEKILTDRQGAGTFNFGYSDQPIRVGGTWRQSVASSAQSGPIGGDYLYTFVGFRDVEGRRMAVVHCHVEGSGANASSQATIKGDAEILIDAADGIIDRVAETLTVTDKPVAGSAKTGSKMTIRMRRILPVRKA